MGGRGNGGKLGGSKSIRLKNARPPFILTGGRVKSVGGPDEAAKATGKVSKLISSKLFHENVYYKSIYNQGEKKKQETEPHPGPPPWA